jgi:hypothetical protein
VVSDSRCGSSRRIRSWPDHPDLLLKAFGGAGTKAPATRCHALDCALGCGKALARRISADVGDRANVPAPQMMPRAELLDEPGCVNDKLLSRKAIKDPQRAIGLAWLDVDSGHRRRVDR